MKIMGMFDTVICDFELPDGFKESNEFQTKDMDCRLDTYRINENGLLFKQEYCFSTNDMDPPTTEFLFPYNGSFHFYTMDKKKNWLEYRAEFNSGRLVKLNRE